jgi:hypothetical protein
LLYNAIWTTDHLVDVHEPAVVHGPQFEEQWSDIEFQIYHNKCINEKVHNWLLFCFPTVKRDAKITECVSQDFHSVGARFESRLEHRLH